MLKCVTAEVTEMSDHVWYPKDNPLEGNPESAEVKAIVASLHKDVWTGNPDTDKFWRKNNA